MSQERKDPVSPFSRDGRKLLAEVLGLRINECVSANELTFPIVAVYCTPTGPIAAQYYRKADEPEWIAEFPKQINKTFRVRTLYIELSTSRALQWTLTKPAWEKYWRGLVNRMRPAPSRPVPKEVKSRPYKKRRNRTDQLIEEFMHKVANPLPTKRRERQELYMRAFRAVTALRVGGYYYYNPDFQRYTRAEVQLMSIKELRKTAGSGCEWNSRLAWEELVRQGIALGPGADLYACDIETLRGIIGGAPYGPGHKGTIAGVEALNRQCELLKSTWLWTKGTSVLNMPDGRQASCVHVPDRVAE